MKKYFVHYEVEFGPERDPNELSSESHGNYSNGYTFEFDQLQSAQSFASALISNNQARLYENGKIVRCFEFTLPKGWVFAGRDIWIDNQKES